MKLKIKLVLIFFILGINCIKSVFYKIKSNTSVYLDHQLSEGLIKKSLIENIKLYPKTSTLLGLGLLGTYFYKNKLSGKNLESTTLIGTEEIDKKEDNRVEKKTDDSNVNLSNQEGRILSAQNDTVEEKNKNKSSGTNLESTTLIGTEEIDKKEDNRVEKKINESQGNFFSGTLDVIKKNKGMIGLGISVFIGWKIYNTYKNRKK